MASISLPAEFVQGISKATGAGAKRPRPPDDKGDGKKPIQMERKSGTPSNTGVRARPKSSAT